MDDPFSGDVVDLRPIASSDRDDLAAYLNDPDMRGLRQLEDDPAAPLSEGAIEDAVARWAGMQHGMALRVAPAGEDAAVGHIVADWRWDPGSPFVGVAIAPRHRRRGFGSAALDMTLAIVFEQGLAHAVQAWTPSWNEAGIAFLQAAGFTSAGRARRAGRLDDAWYDELAFDQLKREWQARR
jgi:RimJ/RimL family protein N-acetyltransferase